MLQNANLWVKIATVQSQLSCFFSPFFDKVANYQMKTFKLFTGVCHLKCKFVAITLFKSSMEDFAG